MTLDTFLFCALPYVALILCIVESHRRYRREPFTYSSLSSQFLENQYHFWGMVPFHYGLLTVLTGHLAVFLIPKGFLLWNSVPVRLYLLEITGFAFALLALVGIVNVVARRISQPSLRVVTTTTDWIVLGLVALQILTGIYTAIALPWGSSWFASSMAPYLWSILKLAPQPAYVAPLPWMVKVHILGAFAFLAIFPYSRLVHALVLPLPYLWRKPQVVRWRGQRPAEAGR